ncbi:MAG: hypothetical protein R3A48_17735 [Polyangiales bacterium]
MPQRTQPHDRIPKRWLVVGALSALCLAGGAGAMRARGLDAGALLGAIGARGASRVSVTVGAVANGSGVGGDVVLDAARRGLSEAVSRAQGGASPGAMGARVTRRGHVFDANVVRVERSAGRVRVEASVVVSTLPGRRYEFASTSAITLTGSGADGDPGLADATRRAMSSATNHALEQLNAR